MREDEIPVGRAKDLRGQKFGKLTVLYRVKGSPNNHNPYWRCQCECGKITDVDASHLRRGNIRSCGCLTTAIDIAGQKFGRLTAIAKIGNHIRYGKKGDAIWQCKCECGTIINVSTHNLRSGNTQSCGCLQRELSSESNKKDLTGQRFGKLVALEPTEERQGRFIKWKCRCECGTITYVASGNLKSGHTQSCGCLYSKGELRIGQLLSEQNIKYQKEKTYDDCRSDFTGALLRYDFYLSEENYLIEFDGEQHYFDNSNKNSIFYDPQRTHLDELKNQYCRDNHIPLIRIPYTELDNLTIDDLKLATTKFRVV